MILQSYFVSCDVCHTSRLQIKAKMIHNAGAEIEEAGWLSEQPVDKNKIPLINPYLAIHTCPGCRDKKDPERRGGQ